jgi:NhaP-type Na+/H+ or K+/H+ antiporter
MKKVLGWTLIIGGILLGLYVGFYVFFIGGIVSIIEEIKSDDINSMTIAWSVVKLVFASLMGWLSAIIPVVVGVAIKELDNKPSDKLRNKLDRMYRTRK